MNDGDPVRPVLDNHLHLDPDHGRGLEAVEEFVHLGGTHLLIVNKPSWHLGVDAGERESGGDGENEDERSGEQFRPVFERTLEIVEEASELLPGRAWAILGVHPGLVSRLVDEGGYTASEASEIMQGGIDVAAEYVAEGRALGLKSGRPHYEVTEAVWDASNAVMCHAFERGADLECAVQLHTEASEDLSEVAEWAEDVGLPAHRVVKHYASGRLEGPTPSVMCEKDWLLEAAERGKPFLMETDFVDDADRPGAVLGPKTVPRRVTWLLENDYDEAVYNAHVETPTLVYGIDTEVTLES